MPPVHRQPIHITIGNVIESGPPPCPPTLYRKLYNSIRSGSGVLGVPIPSGLTLGQPQSHTSGSSEATREDWCSRKSMRLRKRKQPQSLDLVVATRKSNDERFLEDNDNYYNIKVLPNKLRSDDISPQDERIHLLHTRQSSAIERMKYRRTSSNSGIKKETTNAVPIASSSTNSTYTMRPMRSSRFKESSLEIDGRSATLRACKRALERARSSGGQRLRCRRVLTSTMCTRRGLNKTENDAPVNGSASKDRSSDTEDEADNSRGSPRPKLTELAKLLEAGSSSFHFETARQANSRIKDEKTFKVNDEDDEESGDDDDENENLQDEGNAHEDDEVEELERGRGRRPLFVDVSHNTRQRQNESPSAKSRDGTKKQASNCSNGRRSNKKPALLLKSDLLKGPIVITPKQPSNQLKRTLATPPQSPSAYLPEGFFDDLDQRLKAMDAIPPNDISTSMEFSFEKRPECESWFETYSRQDHNHEMLQSVLIARNRPQLPYEKPMCAITGVSRKKTDPRSNVDEKSKDRSNNHPTSTRLTMDTTSRKSKCRKAKQAGSHSAKSVKPGTKRVAHLRHREVLTMEPYLARKSPRAHASTRALLQNHHCLPPSSTELRPGTSSESNKEDMMNELSVDISNVTEFANALPKLLQRAEDPLLKSDLSPNTKQKSKKRRRRSSSHSIKALNGTTSIQDWAAEDPMDRLVAANVDSILLDCLEDELPSVTFDEIEDPIRWIENIDDSCAPIHILKKCRYNNRKAVSTTPLMKMSSHSTISTSFSRISRCGNSVDNVTNSENDAADTNGNINKVPGSKRRARRNATGFPRVVKRKQVAKANSVISRDLKSLKINADDKEDEVDKGEDNESEDEEESSDEGTSKNESEASVSDKDTVDDELGVEYGEDSQVEEDEESDDGDEDNEDNLEDDNCKNDDEVDSALSDSETETDRKSPLVGEDRRRLRKRDQPKTYTEDEDEDDLIELSSVEETRKMMTRGTNKKTKCCKRRRKT